MDWAWRRGRGLWRDWWVNLGIWENSNGVEAKGMNSFKEWIENSTERSGGIQQMA